MASILDRYGIKEVADVTFYKLDDAGKPSYPVLYLDTLKVSTIEQTAETAEARGGKGNPALLMWDYGKEINVTLEDALFSAKSMAIMFGNGSVLGYGDTGNEALIMKTEQVRISAEAAGDNANIENLIKLIGSYIAPDGKSYKKQNPKFYTADGKNIVATVSDSEKEYDVKNLEENSIIFCTYDLAVKGSVIEISANSFPGTYYVVGDTFARSEASGDDEFFQFIIPKAKVTSENTITLEAEGDPSVFNMSLRVLRPADGKMMKLVKYELTGDTTSADEATTAELIHNHDLFGENEQTEETGE